jgi:xanthine dehydrogenase YagS FAD-binding subunit
MQAFDYTRPETIAETIALLEHQHDADTVETRMLAGGTDLLPLMKAELLTPVRLLDIKRLADLDDTIEVEQGELRIGALATLGQLQEHPLVRATAPALAEAAAVAASPQLRNMATIGGNVLQRPRCWYFRDPEISCWLKGGDHCPAVEGENQLHAIFDESTCHAVHPSDPATALVALGARIHLRGGREDRVLPIEEFFAAPENDRRTEHIARPDDVITAITIPPGDAATRSTYLKAMDRKAWAFALVSVAARVTMEANRIGDVRLVLGGVAPIPHRCHSAEAMLNGAEANSELFARAAEEALATAKPLSRNAYKTQLAKTLIVRALENASTTI